MRILLATPPWSFRDIYPSGMTGGARSDPGSNITGVTEPLGLLYLASSLKAAGFSSRILDGNEMSEKSWIEAVCNYQPDLLGLTLSAFSQTKAAPLFPVLKQRLPGLRIAVGGPFPRAVEHEIFDFLPEVDYSAITDGEQIIVSIAQTLKTGEAVAAAAAIPGLICAGAKPNVSPADLGPLDDLPHPDRQMVDFPRYRPSVGFYNRLPSASIISARGCPRCCRFCVAPRNLRLRSIENVMEEIDICVGQFGARHILFWDEDLAVVPGRAEAMAEAIIKSGKNISWCASMRIEAVDEKIIKLMRRAGCWKILFGLESGVTKNLEMLDKNIDVGKVREKLKIVKKAGIETFATFMLGIPGETRAEALATIKFARSLPLDYAVFLNFTPFPGTYFYPRISDYGKLTGLWSTQAVSFVPHSMTAEDLRELRSIAYRSFYLRPGYIINRALKMRAPEDLKRNVAGLFATLRLTPSGEKS